MRKLLLVWWVACSAVTWWVARDLPVLAGVTVLSATVFAVLLSRCSPRRGGYRLVAYASALVANQAPAATAGFWPLLPGHHLHDVPATAAGLIWTMAGAVVAVSTFLLVRAWVSDNGRHLSVPRRQLPWRGAVGLGAATALLYVFALQMADTVWHVSGQLLDVAPSTYPQAPGQIGAWALAMATGSLAGAVEEPVYVGLLVLLWPRLRARTFIPLGLFSSVARASIHLYYAAGATTLATAMLLVVLWCGLWSSVSLLLVYRTRLLWPVIIGHGLTNALATFHDPFDPGTGLLPYVVLLTPMAALMGVGGVGLSYAMPRLVETITTAITRRWPHLGQT